MAVIARRGRPALRQRLTWAHRNGAALRQIASGKWARDTSVESCNDRLRDCLNEAWFVSLAHARAVINARVRAYDEERPKQARGGVTPAAHAKHPADKAVTVTRLPGKGFLMW